MENSIVQSLISFIIVLPGIALGSLDYCHNNLFQNVGSSNAMRFSKENTEREFAKVHGFISLHCCSHGYRSIEWFKDGIPYPWSSDVSTLIISPETGNQTIYSQLVSEMDSGEYWCIVRNDVNFLRHDVTLKVSSLSNLEGPPKPTYTPKNQRLELGEDARFYCEAFVGNISLPDAVSEISWHKVGNNSSIPTEGRVRQQIVSRKENLVLGSYLYVFGIRMRDFGEYVCRVSNTGDQYLELNASLIQESKTVYVNNSYPSEGTILVIVLLILSATLSTIFILIFRFHFRLICQRLFQKSYSKRTKGCDILVLHHAKDKDIALNKIVFTLERSYQYKCCVETVTVEKLCCNNIKERANFSRRLIVLLSPAMSGNEWSCRKLSIILQKLISIHPRTIVVLLQPLPMNEDFGHGSSMKDLLQRVYCVEFTESKLQKFWELLTLGLPFHNSNSEYKDNLTNI